MRSIWANTILFIRYYNIQMLIDAELQYISRAKWHKRPYGSFSGQVIWGSLIWEYYPLLEKHKASKNLCNIAVSTCAMCVSETNAKNAISCNQCIIIIIIIIQALHDNVCLEPHGALLLKMAATCGDAGGWAVIEKMAKRKFSDGPKITMELSWFIVYLI